MRIKFKFMFKNNAENPNMQYLSEVTYEPTEQYEMQMVVAPKIQVLLSQANRFGPDYANLEMVELCLTRHLPAVLTGELNAS